MSEEQAAELLTLMRQIVQDLAALKAQGESVAKNTGALRRQAQMLNVAGVSVLAATPD